MTMVKVGIPRALAYYEYFPMWQAFFAELGAEIVVSPPTTQHMITEGGMRVVADTCLPAKVFMGHVLDLKEKCDFIFIPIIRSVKKKVYNCSKFLGLPDMTRAVIPECPPILTGMVDINKGLDKLYDEIFRLGKYLTKDKNRIKKAITSAWNAHQEYQQLMIKNALIPTEAISLINNEKSLPKEITEAESSKLLTIALIGHHYLIYDDQVSHRIVQRLTKSDCRIVTPDMLSTVQLESATQRLASSTYWTWEEEVVSAGNYFLESGVDGVIGVAVFGCGPDSLMMDMVRRQATALGNTPFMNLTLDEHTADTGVVTRLEAFLDMIQRRKRRQTCA